MMKELLAALIAAKLLPETADEAAAVKLVVEALGKLAANEADMAACSADKVKAIAGEVADGKIVALTADVVALKTDAVTSRKDRIRDRAKAEGKVILLDEAAITALSVEQLADHVGKLTVTVPLDQRTKTTPASADADPAKPFTAEQARMARSCGNDPEKVYGKK